MTQRLLITGGAGKVATLLRAGLARPGRVLRLVDLRPVPGFEGLVPGFESLVGSVNDLALMEQACQDVDAVIHLGGLAKEAAPEDIIDVNVRGSYAVLEAAHRKDATDYLSGHLSRLPIVVLARVGRTTGLFRLRQQAGLDSFVGGRERWFAWAAWWSYFAAAILAIAGAVVLRRRHVPVFS